MNYLRERIESVDTIYERPRKNKKKLFVISPMGGPSGEVRDNSNEILSIIRRASGDEFIVRRSDDYNDERITNVMLHAIATDHTVVAYLGKPPWNANVMLEIGYRMSTNRPLLLLVEEGSPPLPFDLQDFRHCVIPKAEELGHLPLRAYEETETRICKSIAELTLPSVKSAFPVAEVVMDTDPDSSDEEKRGNSVFTLASRAAEGFFHAPNNLIGRPIQDVLEDMLPFLEESQLAALDEEQNNVIGKMNLGKIHEAIPRIPFIFKNDCDKIDAKYRGNAYLPITLHYSSLDNSMVLKILYNKVPIESLERCGEHLAMHDVEE